jgi:hypothetical protein
MSLQSSKSPVLLRKRDASPFLDAALEFLFAIVERELQKKEPAYLAPSIHEFYTLSMRSNFRKTRRNRTNRSKPTISPALHKLLRYMLGSKLTQLRSQRSLFQTCLITVLLALFAYSEFLHSMDPDIKTADAIHGALAWYFSHYFRPVRREAFLAILKHHVFEKRSVLLQTYFSHPPSFSRVGPAFQAMQSFFLDAPFQTEILPALFQCMK